MTNKQTIEQEFKKELQILLDKYDAHILPTGQYATIIIDPFPNPNKAWSFIL
jgi:hypothetical protein